MFQWLVIFNSYWGQQPVLNSSDLRLKSPISIPRGSFRAIETKLVPDKITKDLITDRIGDIRARANLR